MPSANLWNPEVNVNSGCTSEFYWELPKLSPRFWLSACLALLVVPCLFAQDDSRASVIQREREEVHSQVKPETMNRVEKLIFEVEDKKLLPRINSGWNGFRAKIGGLPAGGGFAAGPEYSRDDLLLGNLNFRTSAELSLRLYQKYELGLSLPKLASQHLFLDFHSLHRNYPQINYYGSGPKSLKGQRSNYRLEDTASDFTVGVRPIPMLRLGGSAGYLWVNVGPGTNSNLISTEKQFTPTQAPGIDRQTDFFRYGGFVQVDYRDDPRAPKSGGNYIAQYTWYKDTHFHAYGFQRLDVNLEQYIGLFNRRRVIALRARTTLTDTSAGQVLPFYMQPLLGGSDDLRGFRQFRFADQNMLNLTVEYRWEAFSGLDMAIFFDAGKVFPTHSQLNFSHLEACGGFGLRFNLFNRTFIRMDFGWGREGLQAWFKIQRFVRQRPLGTAGTQPIYN
jgi:outer membrane protein assembly factor BamA